MLNFKCLFCICQNDCLVSSDLVIGFNVLLGLLTQTVLPLLIQAVTGGYTSPIGSFYWLFYLDSLCLYACTNISYGFLFLGVSIQLSPCTAIEDMGSTPACLDPSPAFPLGAVNLRQVTSPPRV